MDIDLSNMDESQSGSHSDQDDLEASAYSGKVIDNTEDLSETESENSLRSLAELDGFSIDAEMETSIDYFSTDTSQPSTPGNYELIDRPPRHRQATVLQQEGSAVVIDLTLNLTLQSLNIGRHQARR